MAYFPGVGRSSPMRLTFCLRPQRQPVGGKKAQKKPKLAVLGSEVGRQQPRRGQLADAPPWKTRGGSPKIQDLCPTRAVQTLDSQHFGIQGLTGSILSLGLYSVTSHGDHGGRNHTCKDHHARPCTLGGPTPDPLLAFLLPPRSLCAVTQSHF